MFQRGTYKFNDDENFNFQLNRVVMWGGGNPDKIAQVSKGIKDSTSWVKALTKLASDAEKDGNTQEQIVYLRMSEFFMYDSDPQKLETYKKAKELFYLYNKDRLKHNEIRITRIPYDKGYLPVMSCKAKGECAGSILLHGGNDSYIEEFFDALLYFQENGFDVYLFEGPGQGGVLREQNIKFTHEWEKPVKEIIDYFKLSDVTIVGASLGGYLAPRAAAFDKRITKVVGWSIFPDFFDILLAERVLQVFSMDSIRR